MIRVSSLIVSAVALGGLVTLAQRADQPCAVQLQLTLRTYTGPVVIDQACLSQPALYGDGVLVLEAVDMGNFIFRGGFE